MCRRIHTHVKRYACGVCIGRGFFSTTTSKAMFHIISNLTIIISIFCNTDNADLQDMYNYWVDGVSELLAVAIISRI